VYGLLPHDVNGMFKVNDCWQKSNDFTRNNDITNLQEIVQCYVKGPKKSL